MAQFWDAFIQEDFEFARFASGTRIVDVGCGAGRELERLVERGCRAVGVEPNPTRQVECRSKGLTVLSARAEELPIRDACVNGVICKVVVPYTDERRAIEEIGRILARGGQVRVCYHGCGYYLRYVIRGPFKMRVYGLRTITNTLVYRVTKRRLPGWPGDTLYQSRRQLAKHYARSDLRVLLDPPAPKFLGLPVFIYQVLEKS